MSFPVYVARRLYRYKGDSKQVSRPAILIATLGVGIGLVVMILTVSIIVGFKREIQAKVVGFGSDIEIMNLQSVGSPESFPITIDPAFRSEIQHIPGVQHVQRYSNKLGIFKTESDFQSISLKGVGEEYDKSFLQSYLQEGKLPRFSDNHSSNQVVISRAMADLLGLHVGDRIFTYFFEQTIRTRRFTIAGIYQTNMSQFDKMVVFTDLYTVNTLNAWAPTEASGLEVKINDFDQLEETNRRILRQIAGTTDSQNRVYASFNIKELYPQIFNWLDLLNLNVWVILGLMICVSSFTMISGLLILILERTTFIGILKTLGSTNRTIRHIFLNFSMFIMIRGLIWGNLIGLGIAFAQSHWHFLKLDPTEYYVEYVPIYINGWFILALNLATFTLSILAMLGPSFLISRIQPAKSIRMD